MEECPAPVFHPFPKESGPARGKGRARAATQRCPAGTRGQGHPDRDTGTGTPGTPARGHSDGDIVAGTPDSGPFVLQDPLPSPPSSGFPPQQSLLHPFRLQGSRSSPSILRNPRPGISPPEPHSQGIPSQGFPAAGPHFRPFIYRNSPPDALPEGSLLGNPLRASPFAGIPARGFSFQPLHPPQGSLFQPLCPQRSLLRDFPAPSPSVLRDPHSRPSILPIPHPPRPLWDPPPAPPSPLGFLLQPLHPLWDSPPTSPSSPSSGISPPSPLGFLLHPLGSPSSPPSPPRVQFPLPH